MGCGFFDYIYSAKELFSVKNKLKKFLRIFFFSLSSLALSPLLIILFIIDLTLKFFYWLSLDDYEKGSDNK